ncbi:hypothetical protein LMG28614_03244 [Paraburkholderia ultramafica]|uniref:Uncharacterized protein n=2 Tax=Paraburkholderia ultramafica TaxID=1544867 RepID=A0A6S7B8Z3_9BURK|nr:hypothetical protein LMG28614_03244 [Paraburkholderia ultramafica]
MFFGERTRMKMLQLAQAHPWRHSTKWRKARSAVIAATLVVCSWTLIETALDFLWTISEAAFAAALSARLVLLGAGIASLVRVRHAATVFSFLCAMSVFALAPSTPVAFDQSALLGCVVVIDCVTKAYFLACLYAGTVRSDSFPAQRRSFICCIPIFTRSPSRDGCQGPHMLNKLHNWIYVGANAYVEYTFVPWLSRNVYRRTVDLNQVCLQ